MRRLQPGLSVLSHPSLSNSDQNFSHEINHSSSRSGIGNIGYDRSSSPLSKSGNHTAAFAIWVWYAEIFV